MKKKVIILGAGVSGLSVGYFLSRKKEYDVLLLELAPVTGGLCASFYHGAFTLDHGPHKIYSILPGILDEIKIFMGERLIKVPKKHRIYLKGHLLDYPLNLKNLLNVLGLGLFLKLGIGYALAAIRGITDKRPSLSYKEHMERSFGIPAYNLVFGPMTQKVWGNPAQLHADLARIRMPTSNGLEIILKLLRIKKDTIDSNAGSFYYPKKGFGDFGQQLKEAIEHSGGRILCNAVPKESKIENNNVVSINCAINGQDQNFDCHYLISTIPLGELSRLIFTDQAPEFKYKAHDLQYRHLILVYIIIKRPLVLKDQWIFFPEHRFIFNRISEQKQMNPDLGPPDKTVICCEFTCDEESPQWKNDDVQLAGQCINGLVRACFIHPDEVDGHFVKRHRDFYPRYDKEYMEKTVACTKQLGTINNLLLTGRLGMYNYNNADHCFDMAQFISDHLGEGKPVPEIRQALQKHVKGYRIID